MPNIHFRAYYYLTKPGIIRGNAITAAAGFCLASSARHHFYFHVCIATIVGLSLVIAAACVSNNFMDRSLDYKMARTRKRALVTGQINGWSALLFAAILGLLGCAVLAYNTNILTLLFALLGYIFYVFVYGLAKRHTTHSTIIGSISGAVPPVVGYVAVTSHVDAATLILFLILVTWQMPHFFAISLYRYHDYKAAGLPVLPVKKGAARTKYQILIYIALFTLAASSLQLYGYTGFIYLAVSLVLGVSWFVFGLKGFRTKTTEKWARQMFAYSLVVITLLCITIAFGKLLP